MYGNLELVINQVKGEYQAKHPRLRTYCNAVLDILKTFTEYTLSLIPRSINVIVDSLGTSAIMFKILMYSNTKYEINVKHRPAIPENVRYWKVFQDDKQINNFLQTKEEFVSSQMDEQFYEDDQEMNAIEMKVL